jgi:hypothetical protein
LTTPPPVSRHRPGQNRRHILDCLHAGRPALFETEHRLWGAEICRLTGLPKGVVYPILRQMVNAGTLIAEQEDGTPAQLQRPLRTYYTLSRAPRKNRTPRSD